jgi:hypothetical protein
MLFRNNPLIDPELLSALTIWIEDVPQITINIFIALCREDAISYYQIIKAGVIIFGGFIRVCRTQLSVVLSVVLSYPRIGKFRYILTLLKNFALS